MRRDVYRAVVGLWVVESFFAATAAFAEARVAAAPLIAHDDPIALPGVGKMVFAFAVTVAVGIGLVYALRRFLPRLAGQSVAATGVQVRAQVTVHQGLRLHVVEVQGRTVLLAESKAGIAMTVMPAVEDRLKQIEP